MVNDDAQVEDVNDHTPTFERPSYETSLLELTAVNERFFMLRASDADSGENGRVSYEISEGNQVRPRFTLGLV